MKIKLLILTIYTSRFCSIVQFKLDKTTEFSHVHLVTGIVTNSVNTVNI